VNALLALLLTLVGAAGTLTVAIREPVRQAIAVGVLGLLLALLFFALQAPDVALSEIVVGSLAIPLMLLLAIAKIREQQHPAEREPRDAERGEAEE
jgi:energy-converting hydrogenase B subunit D